MNRTMDHQLNELRSSVGMTVALISFGMLFAAFFLGYFLYRFNLASWPPAELDQLPRLIPFVSTLLIVLSSFTYELYRRKQRTYALTLTLTLGLVFMVTQVQLWMALKAAGILVSNGMLPSMIYSFSWLHFGHMVLGLVGLIWVMAKSNPSEILKLNIGKFWHFLTIIWIIIYMMFFIF